MVVAATAKSDVGCVRERNEDSYLLDHEHGLFVVADGMGGHAGGARASQLAVGTLKDYMVTKAGQTQDLPPPSSEDTSAPLAQFLADGIRTACAAIFDEACEDDALEGMGTTATALLLRHGWAYIAHVGDSRCYMQRGGRIFQLTEDHSLVNEQVRAGLLTKEMAQKSRMKNIITRSVGFERDVDVDTFLLPVEDGDRFLLCSDGLSNLIEDDEIGTAMESARGDSLVDNLVATALERGGDDNVTVVAIDVTLPATAGLTPSASRAATSAAEVEVEVAPTMVPAAGESADDLAAKAAVQPAPLGVEVPLAPEQDAAAANKDPKSS